MSDIHYDNSNTILNIMQNLNIIYKYINNGIKTKINVHVLSNLKVHSFWICYIIELLTKNLQLAKSSLINSLKSLPKSILDKKQ